MTSAPLYQLGVLLITAIVTGLIAWRIWQRAQIRFSERFSALEDALFKRTPEGWTFDSLYPRIFSPRRWTYLLTDAQKERLAERLRHGLRTAYLVTIGSCVLAAIPLTFWFPKLPDLLRSLMAGLPRAWLLLCLVYLLTCCTLVTAVFINHYRLVHPVLRDARRMGPADSVWSIRLMAETTSARALGGRIVLVTLALLACGLLAFVAAYLSRSLDAELLLTVAALFGLVAVCMTVFFGLAAAWYVTVFVVKLRAQLNYFD
jgi:hypothetical protein